MEVCTIISRSEWAAARALAASVHEHHPDAGFNVLVIDPNGEAPPANGMNVTGLVDLELNDAGLLPALLDREELREALAPVLLGRALDAGADLALFAHPFTRLYGPLERFLGQAADGGLALTPVLTNPIPDDGAEPDRETLESWGAFDPGLIAAGRDDDVRGMLDWWARGATALPQMSSKDPSVQVSWWYDFEPAFPSLEDSSPRHSRVWLDLATGLVPGLEVNRDPGCNVAYWNLHGRRFEANGSGFTIDGAPLRSFQFRGFDANRPRLLSADQDRVSLADEPGLRLLCERYAGELESHGDAELRQFPYGLEWLPDGTQLDERMRRLAREAVARGAVTTSIFSELGQRQLFDWLREPGFPGAPPVFNRYMLQIYKERGDVQRAIPPTDPQFGERFAEWLEVSAAREETIPESVRPAELKPPAEARARRRAIPSGSLAGPSDTWGVNVVGFMRSDFGIAHAGRLAIEALDTGRVPLIPIHDLSLARFKTERSSFATLGTGAAGFPISLLVMNGDHINRFRGEVPPSFFEERYTIAMWFWETDRIPPDWQSSLEVLDELWVASDFVGETVSRDTPLPVTKVGLPVSAPSVAPADRADWGVAEDDFLFLYLFDFGSVGVRKNPIGVVEAFKRAFPPGSGAKLLLKSSYSVYAENEFTELKLAAADHPDVVIDEGRVATDRKNAILAACDCYVSLHRSEGFGLSQAEAMYLGKPLISTAYGGVLEFASADNSYLVDYEPVEVGHGHSPYGASDHWAEPNVEQAAELMRHVFENRDEALDRAAQAAAEIRSEHSPEAVAGRMDERLTQVRRLLRSEMVAAVPAPVQPEPEAAPPEEAPAPTGLWARLRTKIRLRTRVRALFARISGRSQREAQEAERAWRAEQEARAAAWRAEQEAREEAWRREQQLRSAALSAQMLEQVRRLDRAIQRIGSLGRER